jgi:hypothetical protein
VCDNHRECEAARRQGFGPGRGARAAGGHGGHGHGLEWHGEWRGREIVSTLIGALGVEVTVLDAEDRVVGFSGGEALVQYVARRDGDGGYLGATQLARRTG